MSQIDVMALQNNFEDWRLTRVPDISASEAFERYVAEAVFKDADFSDEDISSGLFGGGNDGGVDGAYFLIDDRLIFADTEAPIRPNKAALWLVQAKNEKGFGENPLLKMRVFLEDLLTFEKPVVGMVHYSEQVRDFITCFRDTLSVTIGSLNDIRVNIVYATRSDHDPSPGVLHRKSELEIEVLKHLTAGKVNCLFWGARELLAAKRAAPQRSYSLDVQTYFSHGGSFVGIARLDRLYSFLIDERRELRQSFLEPNVRDYNGARNAVNEQIRATLQAGEKEEFWWLNNGITILAEGCNYGGGKLNITAPEIVNGLQTSTEIFNYLSLKEFLDGREVVDGRFVVVRVVIPPNDTVRRRIIKATNSQTPVNPLSLHANDDLQHDIEDLFKLRNLYYDRRKGEYRRKMMPISQIVTMTDVAQAVMAIVLHSPDDARARPRSRLDTEKRYNEVFSGTENRGMFLNCILIDRIVKRFLQSRTEISKDEKTDLRFYMDTWIAAELTGKCLPSPDDVAAIPASRMSEDMELDLKVCLDEIRSAYRLQGENAKAAKSQAMRDAVLKHIRERHEENSVAE